MLPAFDMMSCPHLAVPAQTMQRVVQVESGYNPFAIGVVGGRLKRQPRSRSEAIATARMLESKGYNFSLGIAQINRNNLVRYGLDSYETAFDGCANLAVGARILAECFGRAQGDWGKAFSCYYSGNFVTGYRDGYVQRISSILADDVPAITVYPQARGYPSNGRGHVTRLAVADGRVAPHAAARLIANAAASELVSIAISPGDVAGPPASAVAPTVQTVSNPSQPGAATLPTRSIFVPHVSGPNDAAGVAAATASTATHPAATRQAQSPREASDAAFVF